MDLKQELEHLGTTPFVPTNTTGPSLNLDYAQVLPKNVADELFQQLETGVEYYEGDLNKVKVFGKWHKIPRQQVAYGDVGLKYHFSGVTVPAKPWTDLLNTIKGLVQKLTGFQYNFVLINRYRDGRDHIGEHRDNEKELDETTPIASLSLGQQRDFILRHRDSRKKGPNYKSIKPVKLELANGSLLLMNPPTNEFWYHSLPARKGSPGVRLNLTFRKINLT